MPQSKPFYHRNLPRWLPEGATIFLTWRLFGSLPSSPKSTAKIGCATTASSSGKKFKEIDSILDKCNSGPSWLRDADIADNVTNSIHLGSKELNFYDLHAFVIMLTSIC